MFSNTLLLKDETQRPCLEDKQRIMATAFQPLRLSVRPHNSKRRSWQLILASAVVCALTQFCFPGQATAQVLDQQMRQLLINNCGGLGATFPGPGPFPAGFGPNLTALCEFNGSNSGAPRHLQEGGQLRFKDQLHLF